MVVIDLGGIDPSLLPDESAIAAVTMAELAAGLHATRGGESVVDDLDVDEARRLAERLGRRVS